MVKTTWKMPLWQLERLQGRIAPLARMLTAVVLMTGAAATIFTARRSRVSAWQALGMAVLVLLLPFGMNWICLFCSGAVHDLMMYAYIVPLLAALAANERAMESGAGRRRKTDREKDARGRPAFCLWRC